MRDPRDAARSLLTLAGGQSLLLQLGAGGGLRIHPVVIALSALAGRAAAAAADTDVGASRRGHQLRGRCDGRLPVEHDAVVAGADHHRGAGLSARLQERVLHAKPLESVAEVADGFLVLEVGLLHPSNRLLADDPVDVAVGASFDADRELLARLPRTDDDA